MQPPRELEVFFSSMLLHALMRYGLIRAAPLGKATVETGRLVVLIWDSSKVASLVTLRQYGQQHPQ